EVSLVCLFDGGNVFVTDGALAPDRFFWPHREWVAVQLQPDVREHPRPPPIAVPERVDGDGPVMQLNRLVLQYHAVVLPAHEVPHQAVQELLDILPGNAQVEIDCA